MSGSNTVIPAYSDFQGDDQGGKGGQGYSGASAFIVESLKYCMGSGIAYIQSVFLHDVLL